MSAYTLNRCLRFLAAWSLWILTAALVMWIILATTACTSRINYESTLVPVYPQFPGAQTTTKPAP